MGTLQGLAVSVRMPVHTFAGKDFPVVIYSKVGDPCHVSFPSGRSEAEPGGLQDRLLQSPVHKLLGVVDCLNVCDMMGSYMGKSRISIEVETGAPQIDILGRCSLALTCTILWWS